MKRVTISNGAIGGTFQHLAPVESTALGGFQPLVSHCCVTRYEDGTARLPGWFTVKTEGALWKVVVKDPDACAQLTAVGQTLDDALTLASLLLDSPDAPWEPDQWAKQRSTGRKK